MDEDHPVFTLRGQARYDDDLRQCFVHLDEMLGDLIPEAGNVFVISDHGMEPCHQRFNINDWLLERGYLVLAEGDNSGSVPISTRLLSGLRDFVIQRGLVDYVPESLKRKSVISRLDTSRHISNVDIDWAETSAYMSAVYGGIDVIADNVAGTKEALTAELEALDAPSMTVLDSRELYHGPNIENVPDLFLKFDDYVLPTNQIGASSLLEPSMTGGKHSMDGLFAAAGPDIESKGEIAGADVMDVAPTALHLLGCPIPQDVDGEVMNILSTERNPRWEPLEIDIEKGRAELSEEERQEVMEVLEDIGYM
jgi:predicted AlkP superfamily phosphohydrolase/phosphomutase